MSAWKFVHAADLHLDSPLRGLERYEGAPVELMRSSTRAALENIVELCIDEETQFLVLAGDIYDGDWKDFSTGLFFVGQMNRLARAGIDVYMVRGNHDALSTITKGLTLPSNVHEFSSRKAQTFRIEDFNVALHGRSYSSKSMTDNLAAEYPQAVSNCLNIGVLHTCLDGRPGHADYAPCKTDELIAKGYDYWALGHVHEQQTVCEEPWIVWSGTSQGRHAREPGAKGCMLVSVDDLAIESVEFRTTDAVRWWSLDCDVSLASSSRAALEIVREELGAAYEANNRCPLAVRINVLGSTDAHAELCSKSQRDGVTNEIRALANSISDELWVEKVVFGTQAKLNLVELANRNDALGGLLRTLNALKTNEVERAKLLKVFEDLNNKLPQEARLHDDPLGFESSEELVAMLGDVENLLVPMLVRANQEEEA